MKPHMTLIKLGGAVITNKEIPNTLRSQVLESLVAQIAKAYNEGIKEICIGNGVGSFAHIPALRYKVMDGLIQNDSLIGMAITQDGAAQINRIVVQECIKRQLPAVTFAMSNALVTNKSSANSFCFDVLEQYIQNGCIPVTYGDVIADNSMGCTIWSTDTIFTFLSQQFLKRNWNVDHIIYVTEAEGVWKMKDGEWEMKNGEKVIYETITPEMKEEVKKSMTQTKGFDVTGGMWHKLEESLKLAQAGIQTTILSGLVPNALYETLKGIRKHGTLITQTALKAH